jgi:adenylosuccinate synthase
MSRKCVLLLSGPVAAGKSTIAKSLVEEHGFRSIRSGAYLLAEAQKAGLDTSRGGLQALGDQKDVETDFGWLIDEVAGPLIQQFSEQPLWILDSVRKEKQVAHFRRRFPGQVLHLHLTTSEHELRRRYDERLLRGDEYLGTTPYDEAILHPNEVASRSLQAIANFQVDTGDNGALARVLEILGSLDTGQKV